jgi:MFS family permease
MESPTGLTGPSAQSPPGGRAAPLAAIVLASFLASLDNNIVVTALPTITSDLGGVRDYTWVSTAYLLAAAISVPVIGKLGDLTGRKRLFQISLATFLAGSALSGASTSIVSLTAFRALQGIGGGGLVVTAMASFAELFAPEDRGRYQGYFAGVLAVSTVGGPVLGGAIADGPGWRWIFYLNLPLGAVALVLATTKMQLASVLLVSITARSVLTRVRSYGLICLIAMAISAAGMLLLASMNVGTPFALAAAYTVLVGVGFGLGMQVLTLAVQLEAPPRDLGAASSVVTSARQIGGSLGLAVLGGIFTAALSRQLHLRNIPATVSTSPTSIRHLDPPVRAAVQASYAHALRPVFLAAGLLLALATILMLPVIKRREPAGPGEQRVHPPEASSEKVPRESGSCAGRCDGAVPPERWPVRWRGRRLMTCWLACRSGRKSAARPGGGCGRLTCRIW